MAARLTSTRLLLAAGIATPLAAPVIWQLSPALALGAMAASHAPLLYGTLRANAQLFGPVVTRFAPAGDEIWLTIDDGPHREDTPRLLDLLDGAAARATFFVRGDHAQTNPDLIAEIRQRGHQLGNHSFSHPQATFWCLPPHRVAEEMAGCNEVLFQLTGEEPRLFRAPVGMANPFVHWTAGALGLRMIGWSARGYDGIASRAQPEKVVERIGKDLRPGAIVLLHEGRFGPKGEALNARALKLLLAEIAQRGWRCVLPAEEQMVP
jgi:peptidoglycan/xylan/chitin deacetylase (PgdA/CDA1 family)